ncbi:DUF4450 domain-containing protein [Parapedobacter tibetensis]|uniref:DUF4450 domain-containing protein n=1 Tax=Parapedobacter tibetensis TaxID=2972951 RepID=UPI00214D5A2A|nr:DUF4450 domain-containing protein [Parapedobacter tibetensis]
MESIKNWYVIVFTLVWGCCLLCSVAEAVAQQRFWHNLPREVRYLPDGEDFVIQNGNRRFNRALYGTNTAFRVEAGDLPEFALYLPGVGGNLQFGLVDESQSKWVINAQSIEARYRPGTMLYRIRDSLLGDAELHVQVLALADGEGMVLKAHVEGTIPRDLRLVSVFGGANGKTFSRGGDIGADPESGFYLHPAYCEGNTYAIAGQVFELSYVHGRRGQQQLWGMFPDQGMLRLGDANALATPAALLGSSSSDTPVLLSDLKLQSATTYYFLVRTGDGGAQPNTDAEIAFREAENARRTLAGRVKIKTPDPFINTLGGALSTAADAIWEDPTFLHGAVAWRMRLNAWRGAYAGDVLGWSDRARRHFESYANSQVTAPETAPVVMDTALHLARHLEEMGTAMFSSGYISRNPNDNSRPHHYDMNLVFFDQVLNHVNWTGDTAFMRKMWPSIKRHLAWEKRNFDMDGDGLYDAYCAIWASDGLQYSGGGVAHTSAYNYRANRIAADVASWFGEDPTPYRQEAEKIHKAVNERLWIPEKGWYAEYQDLLGNQLLHSWPGLWTIYHTIDSEVPDPMMAYQALRYVDNHIPHIPVRANGLADTSLYTLSTTNWQPYTWSVNNVALAEVLHTTIAYWQGNRPEEAYRLWRSNIIESLYLGASPGGFQQLSFYDARRGQLYRDFGDPIGIAARTVVEGLFGIKPNAINKVLTIQPGFPEQWDSASLELPHISFQYDRNGKHEVFEIQPGFGQQMALCLKVNVRGASLIAAKVNGVEAVWHNLSDAIGRPMIVIEADPSETYRVALEWSSETIVEPELPAVIFPNAAFTLDFPGASVDHIDDPQQVLAHTHMEGNAWSGAIKTTGNKTFFVRLSQGEFSWLKPIDLHVIPEVQLLSDREQDGADLHLTIVNHGAEKRLTVLVNEDKGDYQETITIHAQGKVEHLVHRNGVIWGTNTIRIVDETGAVVAQKHIQHWNAIAAAPASYEAVPMDGIFNDRVDQIFKNQYLSPRPTSPTLQLPWQGIGNWCYPLTEAHIDDSGIRELAGEHNEIKLPGGVPIQTTGAAEGANIAFVSKWDNYPDSLAIPLSGKANHVYLLMAGSTNPMQSQLDNAVISIRYNDGSIDRLALRNPENWWPIEQDFYNDGYAFDTGAPHPYRVHLKTGKITREATQYTEIKGFTQRAIDGGAATVLDLPLNPDKELQSLELQALANDVVIGLMGASLQRIE